MMADTAASLCERLKNEGQKTLEFFQALTPEQWEQPIYSDGSAWSVRLILAHFVSAERGILRLMENILAGGEGARSDFDIDLYNERQVGAMAELPAASLLEQYSEIRQQSLDLVGRMTPEDLERTGRHPFLGVARIVDIVKMFYRHNQIHQRDIRKALS
jgi:uncharacterized damage-inducible protein DinB